MMHRPLALVAVLALGLQLLPGCQEEAVDTSGSSSLAGSGGSSTGGSSSGSGGSSAGSSAGGTSAGSGGSSAGGAGSGGTSAGSGGSAAGTGGSNAGTGGSAAGTGGSDAGAGGSDAGSGGSNAGAGGSAAGAGGSDAGAGGSTAGAGGSSTAGSGGSGQSGSGGSSAAGTGGSGQSGAGGSGQSGAGGSGQSGAGGSGQAGVGGGGSGGPEISPEAVELCGLVNAYRKEQGLPEIPLSTAMMTVAAYHIQDMIENPEAIGGACNLHSWSDNPPLWSGCCYTSDHAKAQCMWDKPKEITATWGANQYKGSGYENSAAGSSSPAGALNQWKGSSAHNEVILNKGIWASKSPWPALGCGMAQGYAVLWFGDASDPQPYQP